MLITRTGRIVRGVGGVFLVDGEDGPLGAASARGLFRKEGLTPLVGDRVDVIPSGDPDIPWRLVAIHPRRNSLVRPAVANLDGLVITVSARDPEPDYHLVDKLLTVCLVNAIEPLICLTKSDLARDDRDVLSGYRTTGCRLVETGPGSPEGLEELRCFMSGRVLSFAGQSGVGKSTLLNRLFGSERMPTGELSARAGRGRHTTRHVELFRFSNGYIADTPGFSSLELEDLGIDGKQLVSGYPEIRAIESHCRFAGCRHLGDKGCAVGQSSIDPERLARYRAFRSQLDLNRRKKA